MGAVNEYYQTLGLAPDASESAIKAAFRELAMRHHPDTGGEKERFREIHEAYRVLSDPEARRKYDAKYFPQVSSSLSGISPSLEMTRQKRAARYGRGQYSRRVTYRGTAASGGSFVNTAPASDLKVRQEARSSYFSERYAEQQIRESEAALKGYSYLSGLMQLVAVLLLVFFGGMVLDRSMARFASPETIEKAEVLPWNLSSPGMVLVKTRASTFMVPADYESWLSAGTQISLEKSPFGGIPRRVQVSRGGETRFFPIFGEIYGEFFPLVWLVIAAALGTLFFRSNAEFNTYLGTAALLAGLVVFTILFRR